MGLTDNHQVDKLAEALIGCKPLCQATQVLHTVQSSHTAPQLICQRGGEPGDRGWGGGGVKGVRATRERGGEGAENWGPKGEGEREREGAQGAGVGVCIWGKGGVGW